MNCNASVTHLLLTMPPPATSMISQLTPRTVSPLSSSSPFSQLLPFDFSGELQDQEDSTPDTPKKCKWRVLDDDDAASTQCKKWHHFDDESHAHLDECAVSTQTRTEASLNKDSLNKDSVDSMPILDFLVQTFTADTDWKKKNNWGAPFAAAAKEEETDEEELEEEVQAPHQQVKAQVTSDAARRRVEMRNARLATAGQQNNAPHVAPCPCSIPFDPCSIHFDYHCHFPPFRS